METTTARRRRTSQPIIKAWNAVKGLDYSDKLELVTMIIESVQHANDDTMSMEQMLEGYPYKRYTKAELNAMLDEAEANFEAGLGIPDEEVMREMDEEIERWEQEELEMA
jgi:hypothetical protein